MALRSIVKTALAATIILTPGIQAGYVVETQFCDANQAIALHDIVADANYLAHAGIIAAQNANSPPFNAYFRSEDSATVTKALQVIIDITENPNALVHPDTRIEVSCNLPDYCTPNEPNKWGEVAFFGRHYPQGPPPGEQESSEWWVTFCNHGLNTLQRNPPACSSTVGEPSRGWLGLKFLLQMWDLIQPIGNYAFGPKECQDLLLQDPKGPVANAESYAYMASSAYDMGLYNTGGPYQGGAACPERWVDPASIGLPEFVREGVTPFHTEIGQEVRASS
ncbi:MAG: hypothetical protein Q9226_007064 [Calogaya cf. arnoldii]